MQSLRVNFLAGEIGPLYSLLQDPTNVEIFAVAFLI